MTFGAAVYPEPTFVTLIDVITPAASPSTTPVAVVPFGRYTILAE